MLGVFFVYIMRYIKKDRFHTQREKIDKVFLVIIVIVSGIVGFLWTHYTYVGHIDENIPICNRNKSNLKYAVEQYRLNNKDKQIREINEEFINLLLENKYLPFPLGKPWTPCKYYITTNNNGEIEVLCNFHNGK